MGIFGMNSRVFSLITFVSIGLMIGCSDGKDDANSDKNRVYWRDSGLSIHENRSFIELRSQSEKSAVVEIDPNGLGLIVLLPPRGSVVIYAKELGSRRFQQFTLKGEGSGYGSADASSPPAGGIIAHVHSGGEVGGQSALDSNSIGPSNVDMAMIADLPSKLLIVVHPLGELRDLVGGKD